MARGPHGLVIRDAHYPGRAPIEAYGNGGFRFAGMSHRGSILCLPSGIYGWKNAPAATELGVDDLAPVLAEPILSKSCSSARAPTWFRFPPMFVSAADRPA